MKELLVRLLVERETLVHQLRPLDAIVAETPEPFYAMDVFAVRRPNGRLGFVRFLIENKGLGEVIGERDAGPDPNHEA